jgi:FkbH-like protein
MKLAEAMNLANQAASRPGREFRVLLACGFTPEHVKVFLTAHLSKQIFDRRVNIQSPIYGDLVGSLDRFDREKADAAAVIVEWDDLDPRLGYRSSQPWHVAHESDVVATVSMQLGRLRASLDRIAAWVPVALSLPTLPLPPAFKVPRHQADPLGLTLREKLDQFAISAAAVPSIRVVDSQRLDELSPVADRRDLRGELRWHLPYALAHASALCECLARLIAPQPPKKAIITDLDDTLWRGLLGEDGMQGISWDLDHGSHGHALYQRLLASLGDLGVLLGVATKNDPKMVEQALARRDLIVPAEMLFPVESHWGPKSESVERILDQWNIGPESVVFVDDSPLDLAEVAVAFPEMQGLVFPAGEDAALPEFLGTLRDLFGKASVTAEDQLRRTSLRPSRDHAARKSGATVDEVLSQADAEINLSFDQPDQRTFELINKTNQFNLNGRRIDEATWRTRLADPRYFCLTASYQDKFGSLGKIAVVAGMRNRPEPEIDIWVMSCRAFSRRIEYQMLKSLFERLDADGLRFDLEPNERNGPLREFVKAISGHEPDGPVQIQKSDFLRRCPQLFAKLMVE